MSSASAKKLKVSNDASNSSKELEDFEKVKQYILDCPFIQRDNRAIKAALEGVEKGRKQVERDIKLQKKFSKVSTSEAVGFAASTSSSSIVDSEVVVVERSNDVNVEPVAAAVSATTKKMNHDQSQTRDCSPADLDETSDMLDWQDVQEDEAAMNDNDDDGTSYLGNTLAKAAVDSLARNGVTVQSPVGAIAAVLGAAMRTEQLAFACTGIPEDPNAKSSGFAAPIRELPYSQLLPSNWEKNQSKIMLRYRKKGSGSMILSVEKDAASDMVLVQLSSTASQEPPREPLTFRIDEHINLDSWNAASASTSAIQPALHYKGLAMLLTKFSQAFDLGSIPDETIEGATGTPYVDATVTHAAAASTLASTGVRHTAPVGVVNSDFVPPHVPQIPSTVHQAFPLRNNNNPYNRDFPDDLAPAGLVRPDLGFGPNMPGGMGGNLMGPNHPMFVGGMGGGGQGQMPGFPLRGGPGSMQPRYFPVGPPGGPQEIDPISGGRRFQGEPNPDHLKPPNSFGKNMFS
eukprot:CAMPEP_0119545798 /NCGR_PEP_ID=MMETSP1352-20130426/451_1 /TAXON_ID=265584 /ORGANISM="Stauroneis constricta, Strain CCMP1120" /LENGTH=515 /DNA_ID=CAMNT_0007590401 /DNA_START=108 /DNA_END=1655 /DNA_ORIENTATION=+